jgi:hypothetical protein
MIVTGSKLKLRGNADDVILLCPAAWIGEEDRSTFLMLPKSRPWKDAIAPTARRLMLAVNGFERMNVAEATPVCAMLTGNVSFVLVIKFWCRAGIVTGESRICERADCKD